MAFFRRPSIFALARAAVFLIAPIPLIRWWCDNGPIPALRAYFNHATRSDVPFLIGDPVGWGLERDMQFINLWFYYDRNRPWSYGTCCVVAQTLGVVGAAGAILHTPRRRRGHCPSCGYDLKGLTPDPQGGMRCPECGRQETMKAAASAYGTDVACH